LTLRVFPYAEAGAVREAFELAALLLIRGETMRDNLPALQWLKLYPVHNHSRPIR